MPSDNETEESPSLYPREWLSLAVLIGFLIMISLIVQAKGHRHPEIEHTTAHIVDQREISIYVEGAVAQPITITVRRGAKTKELLEAIELLPIADLSKINPERRFKRSQRFVIPKKPHLKIYVEGAIRSPKMLYLPKGSRLKDLLPHLDFLDNADRSKLERQRRLKDGETINVSYK